MFSMSFYFLPPTAFISVENGNPQKVAHNSEKAVDGKENRQTNIQTHFNFEIVHAPTHTPISYIDGHPEVGVEQKFGLKKMQLYEEHKNLLSLVNNKIFDTY